MDKAITEGANQMTKAYTPEQMQAELDRRNRATRRARRAYNRRLAQARNRIVARIARAKTA